MIRSFRSREAAKIFRRELSRRLPTEIQQRAFMKLNALDAATRIEDLRLPPSNDQWRICFRWIDSAAEDVEIVDYH